MKMRVDSDFNPLIVAFKDVSYRSDETEYGTCWGFKEQKNEDSIFNSQVDGFLELNSTIDQYGCLIKDLVENVHDGELFIVMGESESDDLETTNKFEFYYRFYNQSRELQIFKYKEEELKQADVVADLSAQCRDLTQTTTVGVFGQNPFRHGRPQLVDTQALTEFLNEQLVQPQPNDRITIPEDVVTGAKRLVVDFGSPIFSKIDTGSGTTTDIASQEIRRIVENDYVMYSQNKGELISKHFVAIKRDEGRYEIRLVGRPPYPYYDHLVRLFVVAKDGNQVSLLSARLMTQTVDSPISLEELYLTGVYRTAENVPPAAFALNALVSEQRPMLQVASVADDKFQLTLEVTDVGGAALITLLDCNLFKEEDNKSILTRQALLLLRTMVNCSNLAGVLDESLLEQGQLRDFYTAVNRLRDNLTAVKRELNLSGNLKQGRICIVEDTQKSVLESDLSTKFKFLLTLQRLNVQDVSDPGSYDPPQSFPKMNYSALRSGLAYLTIDLNNLRIDNVQPNQSIQLQSDVDSNSSPFFVISEETFLFSYISESKETLSPLTKRLLAENSIIEQEILLKDLIVKKSTEFSRLSSASATVKVNGNTQNLTRFLNDLQSWSKNKGYQCLSEVFAVSGETYSVFVRIFSSALPYFAEIDSETLFQSLNQGLRTNFVE